MKNSLTDRNYAKQSYTLVNARMSLTRLEIDILLVLMTTIDKNDEDFKDYQFSVKELEDKLGHTLQSKQLRTTIKSLMSKPIELQRGEKNEWEIVNWFSYFKYSRNGILTCRFDKFLKPFLLELKKRFIISDLRMILPIKSSYSKRIYLFLKEYSKIGSRTFEIEEMHKTLKVPKGMQRYDNFKRQILKKAEADINKFTDLEVKLSEHKLGRKVVKVTYTIKKNKNDLKAFIKTIRELYINQILHFTKDNRAIKCNEKGYLYYDDNSYIDKKEAYKLWEYLHENRENLYIFKRSELENIKYTYLANIDFFKEYLKENFVHKKITQLKQNDRLLDISIFPNGRLYDMNGETLYDEEDILRVLYRLAQEGKFGIFLE